MRSEEPWSSDSTTVGASPVSSCQQLRVRPGGGLVGGDDHAARVGHVLTLLLQPVVGRSDDRGHPLARRVQRGPPGPRGLLGGQRLAEAGGVFLARTVPPAGSPE